jgi:hypothetical protein
MKLVGEFCWQHGAVISVEYLNVVKAVHILVLLFLLVSTWWKPGVWFLFHVKARYLYVSTRNKNLEFSRELFWRGKEGVTILNNCAESRIRSCVKLGHVMLVSWSLCQMMCLNETDKTIRICSRTNIVIQYYVTSHHRLTGRRCISLILNQQNMCVCGWCGGIPQSLQANADIHLNP